MRDDAVDVVAAERPRHVRSIEQDRVRAAVAYGRRTDRDPDLPRERGKALGVVGIDAPSQRGERDRAVHRARVEEEVAHPLRDERADRALPRPGRAVDRNCARRRH